MGSILKVKNMLKANQKYKKPQPSLRNNQEIKQIHQEVLEERDHLLHNPLTPKQYPKPHKLIKKIQVQWKIHLETIKQMLRVEKENLKQ